jgi:hypothetical protein
VKTRLAYCLAEASTRYSHRDRIEIARECLMGLQNVDNWTDVRVSQKTREILAEVSEITHTDVNVDADYNYNVFSMSRKTRQEMKQYLGGQVRNVLANKLA